MRPEKTSALNLFSAPLQYVIPVFQRGYVWTLEKQVAPLWLDIAERANAWLERDELLKQAASTNLAPLRKHFLGSIVLTPVHNAFGRVNAYEVIDGQQRTTTLHLLLLAFRHAAGMLEGSQIGPMLTELIRNRGVYAVDTDYHKVWPTKAGRDEISFLNQADHADNICAAFPTTIGRQRRERPLMVQAYLYLHHAILAFLAGFDMDDPQHAETDNTLSDGLIHSIRKENRPRLPVRELPELSLARAQAIYMALQEAVQIMTLTLEGDDDPQVIFETLNARGEPLLASDLIRNFVFLDAARRELKVADLYEKFWQDFDEQRGEDNKVTANRYWREKERQGRITHPRIDLFFYQYTILRRQQETKVGHVFQSFKEWWQLAQRDIEAELIRIVKASQYFKELISPSNGPIAEFARLMKVLDVSTLSPVYLFLREQYPADHPELIQALGDLASYITRRSVCGLTTKAYNRVFLRLLNVISQPAVTSPATELRKHLLGLSGPSAVWPGDREFREHWMNRPVYKELRPAKTGIILRALEIAQRSPRNETPYVPPPGALTIEHILPQGWEASGHYPIADATEERRAQRNRIIQSFGNLTLLTQSLNTAVGNGPFLDVVTEQGTRQGKRTQICQYSLLNLNAYLQNKTSWAEGDIAERAELLYAQARALWPLPASE